MIRLSLAALLVCISAEAITLEQISDKPASREKNFLIWQYLHQDINASEASDAFYQIDNVNERFLFDYAKKTDENEIRYTAECMQKQACDLPSVENDDCLYLGLSPAKALALSPEEREAIRSRLSDKFGDVEWLSTINQENFFSPLGDLGASLKLFLISPAPYREDHFNKTISDEVLAQLITLKGFDSLVYIAVTDPKMDKLQESLANISGGSYTAQTHFFLAINDIRFSRNENALFHLREARKKYSAAIDRDKTLFWEYELTGDQDTFKELANSVDINMYTLYAKEKLGIDTENYFTTLPTSGPGGFKGDDPFIWNSLHKEIEASTPDTLVNLIERYDGEDSVAVQAYMIERAYTPLIHDFTMPYNQYMQNLTNDQKAIVYALMRQETRLIPGLISRSFALGLMQLMPFVVDEIAKSNPFKPTSSDDMFNPEHNIAYAIVHLNYLQKYLYNPVFIAYAYNGGMGFTKRMLQNGNPFLSGTYEPFLSMELISNAESREYGKRVLANYVIYKKILGEPVSIGAIFDSLTQPTLSDYFRAEELKNSQPTG